MIDLLDRRLLFVTGKGGVGKTTVAAAIAELAVRRGKRTLICEMDAKGSLAAAYDLKGLAFEPTEIQSNLFAMTMNTEDSLREYLRLFVRIPFVGRIGPLARTFDFVADAAPGVKEILSVGKLCYEVREQHYDLVIVDAEASGHIVSQIGAPQAIRELVQVGIVRDQTDWLIDILADQAITGLVCVTTPEEMPVTETIELLARVRAETPVNIAAIIANRVLPPLFAPEEDPVFEHLCAPAARTLLEQRVAKRIDAVLGAAELASARHRIGAGHLARLQEAMPDDLPMAIVPELFARSSGRRVVTKVADALAEEGV